MDDNDSWSSWSELEEIIEIGAEVEVTETKQDRIVTTNSDEASGGNREIDVVEDSDSSSDNEPLINIKMKLQVEDHQYDSDRDQEYQINKIDINSSDSNSVPSELDNSSSDGMEDIQYQQGRKQKKSKAKKAKPVKKLSFQKQIDSPASLLKVAKKLSLKEAKLSQLRRKLHYQKVEALLTSNGLKQCNVPADGNCFFNSVLLQLSSSQTVDQLRAEVCNYIEDNKEYFSKYFPECFMQELSKLRENGCWSVSVADAVPLAVANITKRRIIIYSSRRIHPVEEVIPDLVDECADEPIKLAYLAIPGVEHYDSCISISSKTAQNIEDRSRETKQTTCLQNTPRKQQIPTSTQNRQNTPRKQIITTNSQTPKHTAREKEQSIHITPRKQAVYVTPIKKNYTRKRKANPEKWKRNVKKQLRLSGKAYTSTKGNVVTARNVRNIDCSKCKFRCTSQISQEHRQSIFDSYWNLGSYERQKDFVCSRVQQKLTKTCSCQPSTPKTPKRNRKYTREYTLETNGSLIRVCKNFFQSTLDIGEKYINHALENSEGGIFASTEKRGKSVSRNKTPDETLQGIRKHIESFPAVDPHYTRRDTKRKFLGHDLNIRKMYDLYKEKCDEEGTNAASNMIYRKIFNTEYNLSFHKPKKDQCQHCKKFKNCENVTAEAQHQFDEHQGRKIQAREEKQKDKDAALKNKSYYSATFDMQAVLTCPCTLVSQLYYKRKLACYNLSLYSLGDKAASCYVWNETEGKRGSCEIGTCLHLHLKSLPQTTKHAVLWSDSCGGQNRNQFIAATLLYSIIKHPTLQVLDQKFLESGHTQMECDSMHSAIEHAKSLVSIYVPSHYDATMRLARKQKPYTVVPLKYTDILDFKDFTKKCCKNMKVDNKGVKVNWLKLKWIRFMKESPEEIFVKYSFDQEQFQTIKVMSSGRRGRPYTVDNFDLQFKYTQKLPISQEKKADLMSLFATGIIPEEHKDFYAKLPTSSSSSDILPEPDAEESDCDTDDE